MPLTLQYKTDDEVQSREHVSGQEMEKGVFGKRDARRNDRQTRPEGTDRAVHNGNRDGRSWI